MGWLIEMNILLVVFAVIYIAAFRKDKLLVFNRFYLLAALVLSAIIPHLQFVVGSESPMQSFVMQLPPLTIGNSAEPAHVATPTTSTMGWMGVLTLIWFAGVFFMGARFVWRWLKLGWYIRKNYSHTSDGIHWVNHSGPICIVGPYLLAPMEWHGKINHPVIQHELTHKREGHTLDVILAEVVTIACWFNPFAYQLNRSLREVHEYLADNHVIQKYQADRAEYSQWIIRLASRQPKLALTHTFSPSPVKNRLAMLHTNIYWKAVLIKRAFLLPLLALTLLFTACDKESTPTSTTVQKPQIEAQEILSEIAQLIDTIDGISHRLNVLFLAKKLNLPQRIFVKSEILEAVDEMPEYPGGTQALMKRVTENIHYPDEFKDQANQESVLVFIQFIVDKDGTPTNFTVLNADRVPLPFVKAALIGVSAMEKWKPGKQGGKPVAVRYHLPIRFVPPAE